MKEQRKSILGSRFTYDSNPSINLNHLQLDMKKKVEDCLLNGTFKTELVLCEICKGMDFEILSEKDRYGLKMNIIICKQCGLIQLNPKLNRESYNIFYDHYYRKLFFGKNNVQEYERYFKKEVVVGE